MSFSRGLLTNVSTERYSMNEIHDYTTDGNASHAPLDIHPHWYWNNPLNVVPLSIILVFLVALVAMWL